MEKYGKSIEPLNNRIFYPHITKKHPTPGNHPHGTVQQTNSQQRVPTLPKKVHQGKQT